MDPLPCTEPINVIGQKPKLKNSGRDQNQAFHLATDVDHTKRNEERTKKKQIRAVRWRKECKKKVTHTPLK